MTCCSAHGCDRFFDARFARRRARRYRRRGLDKTARRIVAILDTAGIAGRSVLEVGGGVGDLQIELLGRGAASAVNLELSAAYEREAARLLLDAGLTGRVQRRIHDIAEEPDDVEPADVVVLHRVVCCYPDFERLLGAAAARARHVLVFSHPRRNAVTRLVVLLQNAALRLSGREFRTLVHPPSAMVDVCRGQGLQCAFAHAGAVWQIEGVVRPG